MPFFEERLISDTIEIKAPPERAFAYVTGIVDDHTYRAWHEKDHVSFKWLCGEPWKKGSMLCAEEYINGKLHKLKFRVTEVVPNRKIEYAPVSGFLRLFFPKSCFLFERQGDACLFTASIWYRIGWIGKKLFPKAIDKSLANVKKHMKEEGENLKKALEQA